MKFSEAEKKLGEIAKGDYHSLTYGMTVFSTKKVETECRLYLNSHGSFIADTWENAFTKLNEKVNPQVEETPDGRERLIPEMYQCNNSNMTLLEARVNEIEMQLAHLSSRSRYTDKRITEIIERIEALEKAEEEKIFNNLLKPPLKMKDFSNG